MLRKAGQAIGGITNFLKGGMTNKDLALRLLPDAGFGVLAGAMTPGDLGDKIIAGTGSAVGGGLGGLALGRLAGKNEALGFLLDMGGSVGGDFAGMAAADMAMRGKDKLMGGKGETPFERLSAEQQNQLAEAMREQILFQYGLVPGTREQYAQMTGVDGLS